MKESAALASNPRPGGARARWIAPAAEVVVSFASAALLTVLGLDIRVDPLDRLGQVSGLASLEWHYALFALPLGAALVIAARVRHGAGFTMTARLVCAAIAGMATGIVAGGILVAL